MRAIPHSADRCAANIPYGQLATKGGKHTARAGARLARSQRAHCRVRSRRDAWSCSSTRPASAYLEPSGAALPPGEPRPREKLVRSVRSNLLDLDFCAGLFELFLDGRGLVLVHAFLDRLRRAIHEVLRFLQTEARHLADRFDDVDLVRAHFREHDGELRLLFGRSRAACRRSPARDHYGCRGRRRNAEGFLHLLYEIGGFEQRQPLDLIQDRVHFRHGYFFSSPELVELSTGAPKVSSVFFTSSPASNLFALIASLTVTARLRGSAFSAIAMRCAGAFSKNIILLISSSFDGRFASC